MREILGLVPDEIYGEVCRLVVERDAAGVFALVDRLMESGADLAEFVGGAAEMLRTLLMLQVGARPEGLTEAARDALAPYAARLTPGDLLRMLRLLADSEAQIRRSANSRLEVETLLLRWVMLDRMVDLAEVLSGRGEGSGDRGEGTKGGERAKGGESGERGDATKTGGGRARQPDVMRDSARESARGDAGRVAAAPSLSPPAPPSPPAPQVPPSPASRGPIEFSRPGLMAAWDDIAAAAREDSPFLAQALAACDLGDVAPPRIVLALRDGDPGMAMTLERQRSRLAAVLGRLLDAPVELVTDGGAAPPERPQRLSGAALRAERLKNLRARDPALDAAADELDLEIVE